MRPRPWRERNRAATVMEPFGWTRPNGPEPSSGVARKWQMARLLDAWFFILVLGCAVSAVHGQPAAAPPTALHWAYVKPVRPALAPVKNAAWPKNPIDHFVLARLEKEKLAPSPNAPRERLIRRVYLDLIGL